MSHIPPPEDTRPPSPSTGSPGERQARSDETDTAGRQPVRPPPMLTLLAFLIGLGLILAFVITRFILPGHADY